MTSQPTGDHIKQSNGGRYRFRSQATCNGKIERGTAVIERPWIRFSEELPRNRLKQPGLSRPVAGLREPTTHVGGTTPSSSLTVIEFYDLLSFCCFRPPLLGSSYPPCNSNTPRSARVSHRSGPLRQSWASAARAKPEPSADLISIARDIYSRLVDFLHVLLAGFLRARVRKPTHWNL
jgi:hypothetical protein